MSDLARKYKVFCISAIGIIILGFLAVYFYSLSIESRIYFNNWLTEFVRENPNTMLNVTDSITALWLFLSVACVVIVFFILNYLHHYSLLRDFLGFIFDVMVVVLMLGLFAFGLFLLFGVGCPMPNVTCSDCITVIGVSCWYPTVGLILMAVSVIYFIYRLRKVMFLELN